jgi:hypothetical protein
MKKLIFGDNWRLMYVFAKAYPVTPVITDSKLITQYFKGIQSPTANWAGL